METVFLKILNMGIAAGWLILAVIALRFILKKAPKRLLCFLWAAVAVRLICPFSFESALSLIPSAETVSPDILYAKNPAIHSGIPAINSALNPVIGGSFAPAPGASMNPLQMWIVLFSYIWLLGVAVMLIYAAVSFLRLQKRVRVSLETRDGIRICDDIRTPFILGIIKPRIYLPSGIKDTQRAYVVAHEHAHLRRRDHWWKPLGFLLLTVYWFNPLCWLAFILFCRDLELACDEAVVRTMDKNSTIAYSEVLLSCSAPRSQVTACPLAFGEVGVKQRVKSILSYKKPAFWIIAAASVACAAAAVCFLTNPIQKDGPWAKRPTLLLDGEAYINPYMPDSEPPYGYAPAGQLSAKQANDTGLAGCSYYLNPADADVLYVYQECGTPIDVNTVDSERLQWAYVRWVKESSYDINSRLLTLDDVRFLAKKGMALTWSDFDRYACIETGSGLYIRVYDIDELFSVWIGGGNTDMEPMYIYLQADSAESQAGGSHVDIRTSDVDAFIAEHKNDTPLSPAGR